MSEIPKAYEPQAVEEKWYQFWLDQKCFVADPARVSEKRPAYSIVIPPPNITGSLHMGHVLNNTVQDILARKARMDGKEVLWLPGTDHASIATHLVLERKLKKEERITRYDLGREKFIERAWEWRKQYGGIIIQQLKKLGCSCDWARERFTMDPEYSRCVLKVFVELYRKGLIYRGKRMVNWCPATLTALSDEEVVMKEQKGALYYFKVEVVDATPSSHSSSGDGGVAATFLTIATTRPETIPADTGVAVNPKDPRYAHLIGKHAVRPLPPELPREQRLIPIVGDEQIDIEFGTGVLKVTPAHDQLDFEIGRRHQLPIIDALNPDGTMNDAAGVDLRGLDRFKARKIAAEKLKELGALEKEEPYTNNVGFSERADVPIEPRLSEQWFLKYPCVDQARQSVEQAEESVGRASPRAESSDAEDGSRGRSSHQKMRFHPQRWAKVYEHWMTNIQDWCISRQLWWGHRIPVWRRKYLKADLRRSPRLGEAFLPAEHVSWTVENRQLRSSPQDAGNGLNEKQAPTHLGGKYWWRVIAEDADSIEIEAVTESDTAAEFLVQQGFTQDPDVLDTWFSSWLWPFATMGWPEQTDTLKKFYPTTDLVTGPDIIFFWVARMIMAGYEFAGDPKFGLPDAMPFRNVYFTGIIRDKQGRKMSKTLGNSPDPLELIAKYGADALRFGTMRSAPLGQDVLFDEKDVELGRNFCNKLWNACRFRQMAGGSDGSSPRAEGGATTSCAEGVAATFEVQGEIDTKLLTSDDKWILLKLDRAIREIDAAFAEYKFNEITQTLYRFFWSEYCDWYVEASKAVLVSRSRGNETLIDQSAIGNRQSAMDQSLLTSAPTNQDEARRANTLAVIDFVLSHALRLFHPFLPFITEELWQGMGYHDDMPENQGGKTILSAPWPKPFDEDFHTHYRLDDGSLAFVDARCELVTQGRNLRRVGNVPANKKVKFIFKPSREFAAHDLDILKLLLNAGALEANPGYQPAKGTPAVRTELGELFLPLEGLWDVAAEKTRLAKEVEKAESEIAKAEQKLNNPNFVQKVPPQVLEEHRQRLTEWQAKREHAIDALNALGE